jgi:bifunctional DNA primase/polymerase-like protein
LFIMENLTSNFESVREAALFYTRDGWAVIPICQWDPEAGRCSWPDHPPDCRLKRPLIKAWNAKPGDGYPAASRDLKRVYEWFNLKFAKQGIAIRVDGHILIDCDIKNGAQGHESYEIVEATFGLDDTLTQITSTGGWHKVFKLPEGLPDRWLKSWTKATNKIGLSGIDLKVDKWGLLYAEPTRTKHGLYHWVDPTAPIATLPRAACDFFVDMQKKDEPARPSRTGLVLPWGNSDQSECFRDVARGDRHPRLFEIAVAMRKQRNATPSQIEEALRYHDSHFTEPTNDNAYIKRIARDVQRY